MTTCQFWIKCRMLQTATSHVSKAPCDRMNNFWWVCQFNAEVFFCNRSYWSNLWASHWTSKRIRHWNLSGNTLNTGEKLTIHLESSYLECFNISISYLTDDLNDHESTEDTSLHNNESNLLSRKSSSFPYRGSSVLVGTRSCSAAYQTRS